MFRFGDLIAPTLTEHRNVITAHGACWWGWWRRASEPAHHDVWAALAAATSGGKTVRIGLFDSGKKEVWLATLAGVIAPNADGTEAARMPHENDLIPSYYRKSPFSRAWLRLTAIDTAPIEFFGKYSISEPPPLAGHSTATLARLRNKVIIDGDELYGMDTTIWRVRPTNPISDSQQHYLTASAAVNESLSATPILAKGKSILHISDLHFASRDTPAGASPKYRNGHVWGLEWDQQNSSWPTLADSITLALKGHHDIGLVVASGDFTLIGDVGEFHEAVRSLYKLLGILGLGREHLIIVPGNHDIRWTNKNIYSDSDKVLEVPPAGYEAKQNYKDFYKRLLGHGPNDDLSMARRYVMPDGTLIEICAVNSSSLEHGKDFLAGMGRVQEAAFERARNTLGWKTRRSKALRMLVLHHHLVPTEDLDEHAEYAKGFGMALDAPRIHRDAASFGVHLVLHGHRHRTFLWRGRPYELPESPNERWDPVEVSISAVGSAGSPEQTARPESKSFNNNYFNVLSFEESQLVLHMYKATNKGSFKQFQQWKAELEHEKGLLTLGPWRKESEPDARKADH